MKKLLAVLLLALPLNAGAADIFVIDSLGYKMTLTDERCRVAHIVPQITPEVADRILHGRVEFKDEARGKRELCYVDAQDGTFFIEDDTGSVGHVPKNAAVPLVEVKN
jgi:hypothetical protein